MAVSAGGVALGSLILGLSVAALWVYVAAFVLGISSATTNATGMTFFSNVGGASHRGTSMAVFSAALLGGQAVGPAVAGLLSSAGGWRLTMFVATAAALAAIVLLVTQLKLPAPTAASPASPFSTRKQGGHASDFLCGPAQRVVRSLPHPGSGSSRHSYR